MGRVHKKIFEKYGHEVIISGRTSSPSIVDAAKTCDITIVSVPIFAVEETIKKVAPFCTAIADFTSLKKFPVESMLKYSPLECEVIGIHPLYGEVSSISDRTVVVCKTEKTGKLCLELVKCFENEGAKIIEMEWEEHDKKVSSINQALRVKMIAAFLSTMKNEENDFDKAYSVSPPPTKNLIELSARQLKEENDVLYEEIIMKDAFCKEIEDKFIENFKDVNKNYKKIAISLREYFKDKQKILDQKAKSKIE